MKLLIVGYKTTGLNASKSSASMITRCIYDAFKKTDIDVECLNFKTLPEKLPVVDFVLAVVYMKDGDCLYDIKHRTNAKMLVTLRETPFTQADFCFCFNSKYIRHNVEIVPIPCKKSLMNNYTKEKNSILIDHYWEPFLGTELDWTNKIEDWVEKISDKYKIYRMLRFVNEEKNIRNFEIPINNSGYINYLDNTKHIENYVITHKEGFPYGVVDMAVRGTRIFTPPNFIPQTLIDVFGVNVFRNEEEFLEQISNPVDEAKQKDNINKCISYDELARLIYERFKKWY